ncbi:hypothetical protein V7111_03235 [Neobacillus niacini]|uniref:hypothetical protein n=1 Tax=Neobacillus niacini TaxID=86668 RepID=UPI002FFF59FC
MIIASDLDRTLMYSQRALEELGRPENVQLKPVEINKGKWAGYMTASSFSMLKEVNQHSLFIPVTTRTTEQFNRFIIFEKEIPLTYAITTNGAYILYKGEPLKDWTDQLTTQLKNGSATEEELAAALKRAGMIFDGERKQAGKLFFYYLLNGLPSPLDLMEIRELAGKYGWKVSLQGRKLYFIPNAISKGKALDYICNREGMEAIAGAGDSVLDWDFLKNCRYRFVPSHGELLKVKGPGEFTLTNQLGIAAGEEILEHFVKALAFQS